MSDKKPEIRIATGEERLTGLECPSCHASVEGFNSLSDPARPAPVPQPGQETMCAYCGTLLVFVQSDVSYRRVSLRLATPEEEADLLADPKWGPVLELMRNGLKTCVRRIVP